MGAGTGGAERTGGCRSSPSFFPGTARLPRGGPGSHAASSRPHRPFQERALPLPLAPSPACPGQVAAPPSTNPGENPATGAIIAGMATRAIVEGPPPKIDDGGPRTGGLTTVGFHDPDRRPGLPAGAAPSGRRVARVRRVAPGMTQVSSTGSGVGPGRRAGRLCVADALRRDGAVPLDRLEGTLPGTIPVGRVVLALPDPPAAGHRRAAAGRGPAGQRPPEVRVDQHRGRRLSAAHLPDGRSLHGDRDDAERTAHPPSGAAGRPDGAHSRSRTARRSETGRDE